MIVIVEREPLSHLASRIAHDRVGVGVIVRWPMKDLDSQGTFLQQVAVPRECALHDKAQQGRVALAIAELRTGEYLLHLPQDVFLVLQGLGVPYLPACFQGAHYVSR